MYSRSQEIILIIDFFLFFISLISSNFTLTLISSLLTSYYLETSFLLVLLSLKFFLNFSLDEKDSLEILDSSSLELFSSFLVIFS